MIVALSDCKIQTNFDRTVSPPWGIVGGKDGAKATVTLERGGQPPELAMKVIAPVASGDRLRTRTSGGGGYGNPLNRDPERVARDVRLGYVTREAAQAVYGVRLDSDFEVDRKGTSALRGSPSASNQG